MHQALATPLWPAPGVQAPQTFPTAPALQHLRGGLIPAAMAATAFQPTGASCQLPAWASGGAAGHAPAPSPPMPQMAQAPRAVPAHTVPSVAVAAGWLPTGWPLAPAAVQQTPAPSGCFDGSSPFILSGRPIPSAGSPGGNPAGAVMPPLPGWLQQQLPAGQAIESQVAPFGLGMPPPQLQAMPPPPLVPARQLEAPAAAPAAGLETVMDKFDADLVSGLVVGWRICLARCTPTPSGQPSCEPKGRVKQTWPDSARWAAKRLPRQGPNVAPTLAASSRRSSWLLTWRTSPHTARWA